MKNLKILAAVFSSGILLLTVACSTSEPAPTPPTAVTASASDITTTGFTLTFGAAVPDFSAADIALDKSATISSVTAVGTESKAYTVVTSTLAAGTAYSITLTKSNFTFTPNPLVLTIPNPTDVKVTATVSKPSTTGFTLTFDVAITGFAKENITLSPAATITSVTADATNKIFTVATAALTTGTEYTVTLAKTNYTFSGTLKFTPPATAGAELTSLKLGSATIATLKTPELATSYTAGGTTTYANAPRWVQGGKASLKVYFTAATGTTVSVAGADVASGAAVNLSSGSVTLTVTKGTTAAASYTLALAAYEATSNPYGIYTPGDLSDMRNGLAGSYKLMNDVTLPALTGGDADVVASMAIADYATAGWLPVGNNLFNQTPAPFTGVFYGNNNAIKNLVINRTSNMYIGLFGVADGATFKEFGIYLGTNGIYAETEAGSLVGASSNITIIKVYVMGPGKISANANATLGGMIGNFSGKISDSYSTIDVYRTQTGSAQTGGLVGKINAINSSFTRCYSTGAIQGDLIVGGLVGVVGFGTTFEDCYSTGSVTGSSAVGGLLGSVGTNGSSYINRAYASGLVTGTTNVGGLAGNVGTYATFTNTYWDTTNSKMTAGLGAGTSTGVTGKTTAEMQSQATVDLLNGTQNPKPWSYTAGKYPVLVGVGGQN